MKRVDKQQPGVTWNVVVQPKGKGVDAIVVEGGFTTRELSIQGGVIALVAGQTTTISANFMEGKPAKVTNWNPIGGLVGLGGFAGTFEITPHKKLANGNYTVGISTRSSKFETDDGATVSGSVAGLLKKTGFRAKVGKTKIKVPKKALTDPKSEFGATIEGTSTTFIGPALKGKTAYGFSFLLDWAVADGDVLLTENNLLGGLAHLTVAGLSIGNFTLDSYNFTSLSFAVNTNGEEVFGTFSGELTKLGGGTGNGPDQLTVTKGQYRMDIDVTLEP